MCQILTPGGGEAGMSQNKKEQMTIRLPAELKEKIQAEADERGYTMTDLMIFILWKFVH